MPLLCKCLVGQEDEIKILQIYIMTFQHDPKSKEFKQEQKKLVDLLLAENPHAVSQYSGRIPNWNMFGGF